MPDPIDNLVLCAHDTDSNKIESFIHREHAKDEAPEFADVEISYDSNGIKGILNSPFVCGAALLASFGGFSFGYGEIVYAMF